MTASHFAMPGGDPARLGRLLLDSGVVDALLVPMRRAGGPVVAPSLVHDPDVLSEMDIYTPVSAVNLARVLGDISRPGSQATVAAFLRPCEVRAVVELHKLRQVDLERVVIFGLDCLGAVPMNQSEHLDHDPAVWLAALAGGEEHPQIKDLARELCPACTDIEAVSAQVKVMMVGAPHGPVLAASGEWAEKLQGLDLPAVDEPEGREGLIADLKKRRLEVQQEIMDTARSDLVPMDKFRQEFATCLRCGNCREMCPICYCRQCVFESPDFTHEPGLYLKWARRQGKLDLPSEVALFHLTRLNHMVVSCVGCGHCSSACPHDLPVATLFYTLGQETRKLFDYEPGQDPDHKHPFQTFKEDELEPR